MKKKIILLWIVSVVFTVGIAIYQRITGPTYPKAYNIEVNGQKFKIKLLRSAENLSDCEILLPIKDSNIKGFLYWKRYKTNDTFTVVQMQHKQNGLVAYLPKQPAAGKLEYFIKLYYNDKTLKFMNENVVIRFKGVVPNIVLLPHILFMFISLLFSVRAGLSYFVKEDNRSQFYVFLTLVTLFIGGFILGPLMQKYAFGEYWTGFPYGIDLTDNKTLLTFLVWGIVYYLGKKIKNKAKKYALIGLVVMVIMYLIPHSTLGSELDYSKYDKMTKQVKNK